MPSRPASPAESEQLEENPPLNFVKAMLKCAMKDMGKILNRAGAPQHGSGSTLSPEAASSEAPFWNALHSNWRHYVKQKDELDGLWDRPVQMNAHIGYEREHCQNLRRCLDEEQRLLGAIRVLLMTHAADLPFEFAERLLVTFDQIVLWKTIRGDIMLAGCLLLDIEKDSSTGTTVTEFRLSNDWNYTDPHSLERIPFDTETLPTFSSMRTFWEFCQTSEVDPAQALAHLVDKQY